MYLLGVLPVAKAYRENHTQGKHGSTARPIRLPTVLTRAEVQAVLSCLRGTKWMMAMLLYGSGLRLLE